MSPETLRWLRAIYPDAVILPHWVCAYGLAAAGLLQPRRFGVAAVLATSVKHEGLPLVARCDICPLNMSIGAIRVLKNLIAAGCYGFVEHPRQHLIDPEWITGEMQQSDPQP